MSEIATAEQPELDFLLFDADNRCYEPRDSFTRHIEPTLAHRAVHQATDGDGNELLMVGDHPVRFLDGHGELYDLVGRPGSLKEMLKAMKTGDVDEAYQWEPVRREYLEPEARLAQMDEQGVEGCLLFPSVAVVVEEHMRDAEQLYANFHAWNRWLLDDWGFNFQNRIYSPPMLSLMDLDEAVKELKWVIDNGARVISLRAGPAYGRSPADPYFDPFWAVANEAGISVAIHLGDAGYNRSVSTLWGEDPEPSNLGMSAWQWLNCYGDRPIMDTISAFIYANFFEAFPNITIASVENGAGWVPYLVPNMDKMRGMARNGAWIRGQLKERPSAIFRRHVLATPYPEDDVADIVSQVGPESLVLGSDFPHPEGLADPRQLAEQLLPLGYDTTKLIMRDNGFRLVAPPS